MPQAAYKSQNPAVLVSSVRVDFAGYNAISEQVERAILLNEKLIINYVNAYSIVLADKDARLKSALNSSDLAHADGTGIWLAAKFLFNLNTAFRFNWTDHGDDFLKLCSEKRWRIFFLGSTSEVLNKAAGNLKKKYPALQLTGTLNGFDDLSSDSLVEDINKKNPDILYVGMGTPKQELWIYKNADKLNCKVIQAVGDLFSLFAGEKKRGPGFLRKIGLEWFFRLLSNPRKYSKRYLICIPKYILIVIRQYFNRKSNG
jgi:N-acetylglucosaminyldiphosphoundecaprenol N-acetyl-beta-D-mannosaminyltransferase